MYQKGNEAYKTWPKTFFFVSNQYLKQKFQVIGDLDWHMYEQTFAKSN